VRFGAEAGISVPLAMNMGLSGAPKLPRFLCARPAVLNLSRAVMQDRPPAAAWKDTLGHRRPVVGTLAGRRTERRSRQDGRSESLTPSRSQARPAGTRSYAIRMRLVGGSAADPAGLAFPRLSGPSSTEGRSAVLTSTAGPSLLLKLDRFPCTRFWGSYVIL
jgi:hypothetical protein